jgi:hypothetical protein
MSEGRDKSNGRFVRGTPGNPGGIPKRQKELVRALEALGDETIQTLTARLRSTDEKVSMDAVKTCLRFLIPKAGTGGNQVNVQVNNNLVANGREEAMAVIKLRQLHREGRLTDAELAQVRNPGMRVALPAPDVIDVEAVEIEPDKEDQN